MRAQPVFNPSFDEWIQCYVIPYNFLLKLITSIPRRLGAIIDFKRRCNQLVNHC